MFDKTQVVKSKSDGNVSKFVFSSESAVAEAVLYRYPDYATRTVICCSTQSGCPVGCRFCGAGDSFVRSLTAQEIVEQVDACIAATGTDPARMQRLQIMFMSMGEPMLNPSGLGGALAELHRRYPTAALLVSTSAPSVSFNWLNELSIQIKTIGLQFSVHESTDEARDKLIPFKKKMTLAQIAGAGDAWMGSTGRLPFFNYCANDHNSTDADADRLAELFAPMYWRATVSVVCERNEGLPTRNAHQVDLAQEFSSKLVERGFDVRVFDPAGQDDIGGGCGQLWYVQDWMDKHPGVTRPSAGNGMEKVHTPGLGQ